MIEACKAANVHHFIMSLPGGYNMVLNEEANISQGQRQLLTCAGHGWTRSHAYP